MNKLDIENIFLDLDGTTLKSDKSISPNTLKSIRNFEKKINFFIATGRPPYMIKQEIDQLKVNENVICINGGMIINSQQDKVLFSAKIDYLSSLKIQNHLILNNIPHLIYTDKKMFYSCSEDHPWIQFLKNKIENLNPKYRWDLEKIDSSFGLEEHSVMKFLVLVFNLDQSIIDNLAQWLKNELPAFIIVASQENLLDIIPANSSKGEGIKYVSKLLSLNLKKSLAFGDADNDIPMFKAVKYSVAMGNAVPNLKKIATYETNSNDEDGIDKFLRSKVL